MSEKEQKVAARHIARVEASLGKYLSVLHDWQGKQRDYAVMLIYKRLHGGGAEVIAMEDGPLWTHG